jgi:hypothetical protein
MSRMVVVQPQDEPVRLHRGPVTFAAAAQGLQVARLGLILLSARKNVPFCDVALVHQGVISLDEEALYLWAIEHGKAAAA